MRPEDEVNEIQDEARELANYIKKSLGAYKSNPPDRDKSEVDGQPIRAAPKAPQRKRPCRSRALPTDPSRFVALRSERRARRVDVAKRTSESQHD